MASRFRPESIQKLYAAKSMEELLRSEGVVPPPRPEFQFRELSRGWRIEREKDVLRVHNERTGDVIEFRGSHARTPEGLADSLEIVGWRFGKVLKSEEGSCSGEGRFGRASIRGRDGSEVSIWSIVREGHDSFEAFWLPPSEGEKRFEEAQSIVFAAFPGERAFGPQAQSMLKLIRENFEREGAQESVALFQTNERVGHGRKVKFAPCPLRDRSQHSDIAQLVRQQRKLLGAVMVGLVGQINDDGTEMVLAHLETANERHSFWMQVVEGAGGKQTLDWATELDKNPWEICDLFARSALS